MTTLEHLEAAIAYAKNRARFLKLDDVWTGRLVNYACALCRKYGADRKSRLIVSRLIAHRARAFAEEPQIGGNVTLMIERTAWIAADELARSNPTPPEAA